MLFSPSSTAERDPLWRREMRERWRRSVTLFFVAFYTIGLSYAAYSLYRSIVPTGGIRAGVQLHGIGHRLFTELLCLQILSWIPCALLLGAPTIAAERERHALTEYLMAGLDVRQIVRAKFAALAIFILAVCAIPMPMMALCFPLGGVDPLEFVGGFALEFAAAQACAALGILISTHNKRVPPAMQNAIFLSVVLLCIGAMLIPGVLTLHPTVWLVMAFFLILGTKGLINGCYATLRIVAHNLELEEQNPHLPPFSFAPLPESQQFLSTTPANTDDKVVPEVGIFSWDEWVEKVASCSAIALREVRVGIRESRRRNELTSGPPPSRYSLWGWPLLGVVSGITAILIRLPACVYMVLIGVTFTTVVIATLGGSAAFTREREQNMLVQLQVCPLTPLEVVAGKIGALLLLIARTWGGPFLALFFAVLPLSVVIALETTVFVTLTLLFAASLATLLSLVCRRTAVAASTALSLLFVLFVLLPVAPGSLIYFFPLLRGPLLSFPLGPMWLKPMSLLGWSSALFPLNPMSPAMALLRLICSLAILTTLLILVTTGVWTRATMEDGEANIWPWKRANAPS